MVNDLSNRMSWEEICNKIAEDCNQSNNKKFIEWLISKEEVCGGKLLFNSLLYGRIYNIVHSARNDDRDHFIVIAGKEGSGKTTLASQICGVADETFNLKRFCFKPLQFVENIDESQSGKGNTIQLDEGNLFLFSREAMGSDNKNMVKIFALMRQRNLIVIICVPNFFTLDTYVRDHRVDTLINIHERSKFTLYVDKAIKIISKEGAKYKTIAGIKVPYGKFFEGYFNDRFPTINDVSKESYLKYKHEHFKDFIGDLRQQYTEGKDKWATTKEVAKEYRLTTDSVANAIKQGRIKAKKVTGRWLIDRDSLVKAEKMSL